MSAEGVLSSGGCAAEGVEGVRFEPTRTRQRPSGFQDLRLNLADQWRLQ